MGYEISSVFGSVLDADLSQVTSSKSSSLFEIEFFNPEENGAVFGSILELDHSHAHITEDPLIKHFEGNHHILTHNLTLRRVRLALVLKNFFNRKPKRRTAAITIEKKAKSRRR